MTIRQQQREFGRPTRNRHFFKVNQHCRSLIIRFEVFENHFRPTHKLTRLHHRNSNNNNRQTSNKHRIHQSLQRPNHHQQQPLLIYCLINKNNRSNNNHPKHHHRVRLLDPKQESTQRQARVHLFRQVSPHQRSIFRRVASTLTCQLE